VGIAAKISSDTIQLVSSIGAAATSVSGQVPTDQIDLGTAVALFGHNHADDTTWDTIPAELRAAASPLFWAEQKKLAYLPPIYLQTTLTGSGLTPYGASWTGGNVHDPQQSVDFDAAVRAAGKSSQYNFTLRTAWNGATSDLALTSFPDSERLYSWLLAQSKT
jgi:hypothetical protein